MEEQLIALLKKGVVKFTFKKKDGSLRTAIGTRNLNVASEKLGYNVPAPQNLGSNPTAFYDLEKDAWRSFSWGSVVSIDE